MAKEKLDYSKLTLGTGKRKAVKKVVKAETIDEVVQKIHQPEEVKEQVRTKRITIDIPVPLHAEIRKKTFDMGITMKQYFLGMAQEDLGL